MIFSPSAREAIMLFCQKCLQFCPEQQNLSCNGPFSKGWFSRCDVMCDANRRERGMRKEKHVNNRNTVQVQTLKKQSKFHFPFTWHALGVNLSQI